MQYNCTLLQKSNNDTTSILITINVYMQEVVNYLPENNTTLLVISINSELGYTLLMHYINLPLFYQASK